ncbi:concanavalin A-like lectin/glucanase domain-containing protein [Irpex rosettiformis]|uniref:Concanavalin A-like lectin/glucanase domain-containing protein n=1 Tax=Irpex rosettiformis TaxID=378272 RepID=A0ACB8TT51_9APHY|nr:concanavalin A-like lectin/glucanase domain-containing protein [Irpex rosettiformis]
MRTGYAYPLFCAALVTLLPIASAHYSLKDAYIGHDFYSGFQWETAADPTHGRVNYVDQDTATSRNLSQATDNKFIMRADNQNVVSPSARGRDSVRISSWNAYGDSVIVLDIQHMPEGCSTWPAFWTLSQKGPWPKGGEIDIIEGVNMARQNLVSLHTSPSCMMPQQRYQAGNTISTNCDAKANFNQGCGTQSSKGTSYGSVFNTVGGGFYAMARSVDDGIRVWFWQRDDPLVPQQIRDGWGSVSPDPSWGVPEASFPNADFCDYESHFDQHMIVFDLTFCGDWAGADYPNSGCGSNCEDFVNNNPDAFDNAYWEINALRVYTPN